MNTQLMDPNAQQAFDDLLPKIKAMADQLTAFFTALMEDLMPALKAFAESLWPVFQEFAIQHEIEAGWTPWVARLRIRHVLDHDEVIALAEKYIEEHKNDRHEEEW